MGNYRVYDRRNYDSVSREINSFLKKYGKVEIKSKKNQRQRNEIYNCKLQF